MLLRATDAAQVAEDVVSFQQAAGESLLSGEKEKHDQKAPEDVADWKWETTRFR